MKRSHNHAPETYKTSLDNQEEAGKQHKKQSKTICLPLVNLASAVPFLPLSAFVWKAPQWSVNSSSHVKPRQKWGAAKNTSPLRARGAAPGSAAGDIIRTALKQYGTRINRRYRCCQLPTMGLGRPHPKVLAQQLLKFFFSFFFFSLCLSCSWGTRTQSFIKVPLFGL